ncbi:MAG TPA: DUF2269 family protein [Gaiellaceae bacterium]|nr:DUF2269 family protein [Gaiellaceae bacterium]HET8653015.1 DUF2269 family protein [Gaiellaceae bacterium]
MTWYELWLFLHVTAVIAWVGGAGAIQVFGVLTKRAADPAKTAFFVGNVAWTVLRVFLPASVLVVVSGIGLTETSFWDWDDPFVAWGLVLWAAISAVAFGYLARAMRQAGARLASEGPSPELGLRLRNLVWLSRVLLGALLLVVFLMTVKPGS